MPLVVADSGPDPDGRRAGTAPGATPFVVVDAASVSCVADEPGEAPEAVMGELSSLLTN